MPDLFPDTVPSLDEQIREVRRELQQRDRVYPRFVRNGVVTQARADHQMAAMRAALDTLERLKTGGSP